MPLSKEQLQDVTETRSESLSTYRATVPALEEILYKPIPALDHGFIRVIDYMGDDASIVQAARVSYGKGTKKISQDQGLINYLMRHRHTTPFEMCEIKIHVKLPIFIARQWIRHRTANVNEYSARYSILGREFYVPEPQHLAAQSTDNRQGRGKTLVGEESDRARKILKEDAERAYAHYEELMNCTEDGQILDANCSGLTRELARTNLTLNYYTEWYWKIDLLNLLHFIGLRGDSHAQHEIQVYADILLDIVKKWVPFTADAFIRYQKEGASFSREGLEVIKKILRGEEVTKENSGMSAREWREFRALLELEEEERAA